MKDKQEKGGGAWTELTKAGKGDSVLSGRTDYRSLLLQLPTVCVCVCVFSLLLELTSQMGNE